MQRTLHRLIISGISILLGPVLQASISGQIYPMSQKRIFQSIDSELSYMAVRDITEDGNGFIWIATLKGLNKYDGYNITKFYAADGGLSSSCVESIEAIGKNVLIGTDKGVCIYDARDEKILPGGTGYITDLGMTGVQHQVIGSRSDVAIRRQLTQVPYKSEVAEGRGEIRGVLASIDAASGKTLSISRI